MKIDYCLILAAGFGTRMGDIGKILPKVLWPVFEKSLLELEILYARSLGIKKIYINLHHQSDLIEKFINSIPHDDITVLFEPEILDVGGAVQNLASQNEVSYQGNLLILNSDQFLFFEKSYFSRGLSLLENYAACLFMIKVDKTGKYNQVQIKENADGLFFDKIIKSVDVSDQTFWTYSGNSLVNLDKIPKHRGKTSFYETVARYEHESIPVIKLEKLSYWDFGTLPRYLDSLKKIIGVIKEKDKDEFVQFLIQKDALNLSKLNPAEFSYNSKSSQVLDFSPFSGPKITLNQSIEFQNIKLPL